MLYAVTIVASAFLVFAIQPLVTKQILPWFGGSAAVWTACLVFFQLVLLAGYAYAHAITRWLSRRAQLAVHAALLVASCALLPVVPSPSWAEAAPADPSLRILALLAATIGLPYFALSATSPLLQAWLAGRGAERPHRLYALSNAASLAALVGYPFVIEPNLGLHAQAWIWSACYVGFALACLACAVANRRGTDAPLAGSPREPLRARTVAHWIALSACSSALLAAITNHLGAYVAAIPLLWVAPLAIYLATFALAFARDFSRGLVLVTVALGLVVLTWLACGASVTLARGLVGFGAGLAACCLFCHCELARRRPAATQLTGFYLAIAFGGVLGSALVALVAPRVFDAEYELALAICACSVLAVAGARRVARGAFAGLAVVIAIAFVVALRAEADRYFDQRRDFYGLLAIRGPIPHTQDHRRTLVHGTIDHGTQLAWPGEQCIPTAYYGTSSGIGRAIRAKQARGPVRIGSVGLGAGVLAAYGRPGDRIAIYELDPLVYELATTWFSFLTDCPGAKSVTIGDGRLSLEAEPPHGFDVLSIDAFSGDAIPVHLLTREAFALYFRALAPGGVLALHISNRYVDLEPIAARGAEVAGWPAIVVHDRGSAAYERASTWVLISADPSLLSAPAFRGADTHLARDRGMTAWTDDRSSLFDVLRL
ncbi:MAG TPA: fused MFS/spermidine synthase [Kofleriaceae bacterium]|jgi:hypothetical protein